MYFPCRGSERKSGVAYICEQEENLSQNLSALADSHASLVFENQNYFDYFKKTDIITIYRYKFFVALYVFKTVLTCNIPYEAERSAQI